VSRSAALLCVLLAAATCACGKKGPPLPPLVRLPVAPGDFVAARRGTTSEVRFVVPGTNTDGSKPADLVRVDVYAMSSADSVTDEEVVRRGRRIGMLEIKPPLDPDEDPDAPRPETEKEKGLLDQGAPAQVNESIPDADGEGIRYYVSVGINKRGRRGPVSRRSAVPLGPAPAALPPPQITYDEKSVTIAWPGVTADPPGAAVEVYDATTGRRLTDKPVAESSFADQRTMEWGVERCYAIGRLAELDRLPVESEPSAKTCVTLMDTFAPAAPTGLTAVAAEGSVNLIWNASAEKDLAGYLVLRGIGGEKQKAITANPIQETTFRDVVPSGTRATYAIQAVDKAGNISAMSQTTEEMAR
jgi:hypothetical protein